MTQNTEIALAMTAIVIVNEVKNLVWTGCSKKRRYLFLPQLKFAAKFVPAMLVGIWAVWGLK